MAEATERVERAGAESEAGKAGMLRIWILIMRAKGLNPQKGVRGYQDQLLLIALRGSVRCFRQNKIAFTQRLGCLTIFMIEK